MTRAGAVRGTVPVAAQMGRRPGLAGVCSRLMFRISDPSSLQGASQARGEDIKSKCCNWGCFQDGQDMKGLTTRPFDEPPSRPSLGEGSWRASQWRVPTQRPTSTEGLHRAGESVQRPGKL